MTMETETPRTPRRAARALPRAALYAAMLAAVPVSSGAFDVNYEIGLGARHSDNIRLTEFDETSDTVVGPVLRLEASHETSRVQFAARGGAQYQHYLNDTFDDEIRGTFSGRLNWEILPDRLDFVVQDYLTRQPVNELEPRTPANEQQANILVLGPSLHARFSPRTRGQLDLRFTDSYAEQDEGFNGNRYDATARLVHRMRPTRTVSLNLHAGRTDFDEYNLFAISPIVVGPGAGTPIPIDINDPLCQPAPPVAPSPAMAMSGPGMENSPIIIVDPADPNRPSCADALRTRDYDLYDGYVRYEADRRRLDTDISLGYSRLKSRATGRYESEPLFRADITLQATGRSGFTLQLRNQLLDATQGLIESSQVFEGDMFDQLRYLDTSVRPNPYRERTARLRYRLAGDRTVATVTPYARRVRYIDDFVPSENRRGVFVGVEHRLRPRLDLSVQAGAENREYTNLAREDDNFVVGVGLTNRFTRNWTGRVELQHVERDSSALGRDYKANAVLVSFTYRR